MIIYYIFFTFSNFEKNCKKTAKIIIQPPNITKIGGFSFANIHAHKGPNTASVSIIIPTIAEGVVLAPIVIIAVLLQFLPLLRKNKPSLQS